MKLALIISAIVLASSSMDANAFSVKPPYTGDWTRTEYGAYTASHTGENTIAVLINKGGLYDVGVLVSDNTCVSPTGTVEANDVRINGQLVKFTQRCADEGFALYQPTTETGATYMFDQFKAGGMVTAGEHRFSAEGFVEMYSLLNKSASKSAGIYEQSSETAI